LGFNFLERVCSSKWTAKANFVNFPDEELISKAEGFQQAGEYRNALSFYDQALLASIDSNELKITALIGKGFVLNAMGEYDEAIKHYDLALEIEPDNLDLLKKKSFTLAQLGLLDEAREYYVLAKQMKSE